MKNLWCKSDFVTTIGYDKSWENLYFLERCKQQGRMPNAVIKILPLKLRRITYLLKNRGLKAIWEYFNNTPLKGQCQTRCKKMEVNDPSIYNWCIKNSVNYISIRNQEQVSRHPGLKYLRNTLCVYNGGGILTEKFIRNFKAIINAHGAKLPEIRGIKGVEWSILLGQPIGVTLHLIDNGIDTGEIIIFKQLRRSGFETIQNLYDRNKLLAKDILIEAICNSNFDTSLSKIQLMRSEKYKLCTKLSNALEEIVYKINEHP